LRRSCGRAASGCRSARPRRGPSSTVVATRIDEARDITRYITNLLIFLGLLGTFYGLATTVPAVVDTIRSLAPQQDEGGIAVFERLMTGLEAQLGGMGVAFASSLLGLAGSLVVGLLELFASTGRTASTANSRNGSPPSRVSAMPAMGSTAARPPAAMGALDYMAEHMSGLRELFESSEASRSLMDDRVQRLADAVEKLASPDGGRRRGASAPGEDCRRSDPHGRTSGGAGAARQGIRGGDVESRMRLRSMDVQLLRILEEMSAGRQESIADLRSDLAQLTRAVRQIGKEGAPITARRSG
jgi:hypothetical protein